MALIALLGIMAAGCAAPLRLVSIAPGGSDPSATSLPTASAPIDPEAGATDLASKRFDDPSRDGPTREEERRWDLLAASLLLLVALVLLLAAI